MMMFLTIIATLVSIVTGDSNFLIMTYISYVGGEIVDAINKLKK